MIYSIIYGFCAVLQFYCFFNYAKSFVFNCINFICCSSNFAFEINERRNDLLIK